MKLLFLLCALLPALSAQPATEDFRVTGVVVDHATNRPLKNVLVQMIRISKGGGEVSAVTAEDGRFNFLHVPKGKYQLMAEKRGQMPVQFGQSDGGYATAIVVDGTLNTENLIFSMPADGHIDGVVMGDDGEPVRNAQVNVFRQTVVDGEAETTQTATLSTDSAGHFHVGHLAQGKYYLAVSATPWFAQPRIGATETVYPVTFYGDTTDGRAAKAVVLTEGGLADVQINLRLVPGIHVKLPANARGVALFVPGPGNSQIPAPVQYTQTAQGSSNAQTVPFPRGVVVSSANVGSPEMIANGSDEILSGLSNLAAGRYKASVFGENGGSGQTSEIVELSDGSTLNLSPSTLSSISGKLVFEGAQLHPPKQIFLGGHNRGGIEADLAPDGTFRFDNVAEGEYELNLADPAMVITSIGATGASLLHDQLNIPSGSAVEVTAKVTSADTLSTLEGFALNNGHGQAAAMVLLIPKDTQRVRLIRRDQSDADGSFTLPNIVPGQYTLVAIDDGHDLAYKTESVIRPYFAGGVPLTFPLASNNPVTVPIQVRKP